MAEDLFAIFAKNINGLIPANEAAAEALRTIKWGERVKVEISRPRNLGHHNKYFALVSRVAAAIGRTTKELHYVIKLRAGFCIPIQTKEGIVYMPDSISWARLDQAGFADFYERALDVICTEWLPHMKPSELRDQIEELVAA